eukprot:7136218-Prymnesium_polylepis.1
MEAGVSSASRACPGPTGSAARLVEVHCECRETRGERGARRIEAGLCYHVRTKLRRDSLPRGHRTSDGVSGVGPARALSA